MNLFKLPERRVRIFVPFVFLSILYTTIGCTFGSQGMGHGFSPLGIYCVRGAVKFSPTPAAIAGGPSEGSATPVSDEDCKQLADGLDARWEFRKPGDNNSVISWTKWDIYDSVLTADGSSFCVIKVYIPSNEIFEKGLGEWQAEFSMGDWSVTCPVVNITFCSEDDHQAQIFQIFNSTQNAQGCETGSQGINEGDIIPFPG